MMEMQASVHSEINIEQASWYVTRHSPNNALCARSNWLQVLVTFQYCEFGITHLHGVQGMPRAHDDPSRANNPIRVFFVCNEKSISQNLLVTAQ